MKSALTFLVLAAITCLVLAHLNEDWIGYKEEFSKIYDDSKEDGLRKEIFRLALEDINEHNKDYEAKKVSYSKGLNQFTDLTADEFRQRGMNSGTKKLDQLWSKYKIDFNKTYDTKEDALRNTIFCKKVAKIEKHNKSGKFTWTMGTNEFTDMTLEELKLRFRGLLFL